MPSVRRGIQDTAKFYRGGIKLYPEEELYREMSFISYYFHWPQEEVLAMDHVTRRRWCGEISRINQSLNPSQKSKEKSIVDMKPTR